MVPDVEADVVDDVGAQMQRALDELWEWGQQAVADNGGEPKTWHVYTAPDVTETEEVEIAEAIGELDAVRYGPEDRGPADAGPR